MHIFEKISPGYQDYLIELGCGDGSVLRTVAQKWKVQGKGVDVNPILIFWARLRARHAKLTNVSFATQSIQKTDLTPATIIYIFLFPKLIDTIQQKLLIQLDQGTLIISHGFRINFLENYLRKDLVDLSISEFKFKTFYYQKSRTTID